MVGWLEDYFPLASWQVLFLLVSGSVAPSTISVSPNQWGTHFRILKKPATFHLSAPSCQQVTYSDNYIPPGKDRWRNSHVLVEIMALNPPKLGVPFKQAEAVGAAFKGKVCLQYKFQ